jgi:hypothetical protein
MSYLAPLSINEINIINPLISLSYCSLVLVKYTKVNSVINQSSIAVLTIKDN